jgi:NAD(P)H-nitrite reductase large subunit
VIKKIVVIGASAASIGFISKLRSFDTQSQIICFSGESHTPYNRCLLEDFVSLDKDFTELQLKPEEFFKEHCVDLRLSSWVTSIDRQLKNVTVNGEQESYDYLFIGTGTSPFIPKIPGTDLLGVFGFHNFADVDKLDDFIQNRMPKFAVVVGAGINGIEAASALVSRGLKVTVVDLYDSIMPLQVDKKAALFVETLMKDAGVTIFKGQKIVGLQVRNKDAVGRVQFESGAFLPTDCVVLATGSRVNSALVESAGLKTHEGSLVVNDSMQTSDPAIYAGGDICMAPDILSKELVRSMTWSDAMLQGLTAATQLSDTPRLYPGIVGMRDSQFFGLEFYACGQTSDVELFEVIEIRKKEQLHKFYLFDNQLKGFI